MLEPRPEEWTVVLLGNWNVSIFNPAWLTKNLFENETISLELPMIFGLAPKIKGDDIILIPSNAYDAGTMSVTVWPPDFDTWFFEGNVYIQYDDTDVL